MRTEKRQISEYESPITIEWNNPIPTKSDFWIVQKSEDIHYSHGIWKISTLGPPPLSGKWEKVMAQSKIQMPTWRFCPAPSADRLMVEKGEWIFFGRKPEFSYHRYLWEFVGEAPRLIFSVNGMQKYSRFSASNRVLQISANRADLDVLMKGLKPLMDAEKENLFAATEPAGKGPAPDSSAREAVMALFKDDQEGQALLKKLEDPRMCITLLTEDGELGGERLKFLDYFENEIGLEVQDYHPSPGVKHSIRFQNGSGSARLDFMVHAAVSSADKDPNDSRSVIVFTMDLGASEQKLLDQFVQAYSDRQDSVTEYFEKAKGM